MKKSDKEVAERNEGGVFGGLVRRWRTEGHLANGRRSFGFGIRAAFRIQFEDCRGPISEHQKDIIPFHAAAASCFPRQDV